MANIDKIILNGTQYDLPSGGGSTYTAGANIDITNDVISVDIDDEKKVIASALTELHNDKADKNQLNNYQLKGNYVDQSAVDASIAAAVANYRTEAEAIKVEKVDAAALTDLNARVTDLEQGGGGSGITGITMNGSAVTVTSGVANLGTVVTDISGKQDAMSIVSPLNYNENYKTLSFGIQIAKGNSGEGNFKMNGKVNYLNNVTGDYSVALGANNTVSGNYSAAIGGFDSYGAGSTVSGSSSIALGRSHNIAKHIATATGQGHTISNDYETAVGRYSQSNHSTDTFGNSGNTLFVVGNGTSASVRSNAFEIRQNGDIYITKDGQDVKLQDQLGGGSSYTAGDGIDITSDVISNTREQRVLRYDDTITGVKAALKVVSPHWTYTTEKVEDVINDLTFVNNVPAANADPYTQANFLDGTLMEFDITDYDDDSSSNFYFDPSEVTGGVMLQYDVSNDVWVDITSGQTLVIFDPTTFLVGDKYRLNSTMLSALISAMQADCPYSTMEVQYKTYAWSSAKSVNAIHSGTSYPLAYNSDLTALAARVTALETALGNISSSLDTINGEVI